jgi:hypothetical protein
VESGFFVLAAKSRDDEIGARPTDLDPENLSPVIVARYPAWE